MPVCGSAGANDNCLRNTEQLERTLAIEGVPRDSPIYVATDEQLMNRTVGVQSELGSLHELALRKLRSYYPRLILRQSIAPELVGRPREFRAAVDFYIAQSATRFIGNSVSTFSAHLLMQREYWGLDAQKGRAFADFHYNGGSVPLQEVQFGSKAFCTEMDVEEDGRSRPPRSDATEASCYAERYPDLHAAFCKNTTCDTAGLKAHYKNDGKAESRSYGCETPCMHIHSKADGPARPLKWVFTVNAASADVFVEMAKVAVTSARQATSLVPVCIFLGPPGSLSSWLTAHGVRVIFHEPPWRARLLESLKWAGKSLLEISPLFKDETALVSAFARVDIPVLGFADPYVFYADVDVLFLRDITLQDFYTHGSKHRSRRSSLLPFAFAVGTEAVDSALISYQKDWNHPARIVSGGNIVEHQARVMYGNTGVMLLNVDTMRRTHRHFVSWLLGCKHRSRHVLRQLWPCRPGRVQSILPGDVRRARVAPVELEAILGRGKHRQECEPRALPWPEAARLCRLLAATPLFCWGHGGGRELPFAGDSAPSRSMLGAIPFPWLLRICKCVLSNPTQAEGGQWGGEGKRQLHVLAHAVRAQLAWQHARLAQIEARLVRRRPRHRPQQGRSQNYATCVKHTRANEYYLR